MMISKNTAKFLCLLIALLPFITAFIILSAHAQSVGVAFSFSDVSLQHSDLKVYQINNGSMVYVMTINSTAGEFIYDPTSDYIVVFQPTIANTYGSSAEGVLSFVTDNPELAAIVLAVVVFFGLFCIFMFFLYATRRR